MANDDFVVRTYTTFNYTETECQARTEKVVLFLIWILW
jgi:hypothetical protein